MKKKLIVEKVKSSSTSDHGNTSITIDDRSERVWQLGKRLEWQAREGQNDKMIHEKRAYKGGK